MSKTTITKSATKTLSKKKMSFAMLNIQSTYNNTMAVLADEKGGVVASSSCGALGFNGAKKGTPFAAAKVGEVLADKALLMGVKEVGVIIKGTGSGRESVVRSFIAKGINVASIQDRTPVPHNGPKPKKPRRI